MNASGGARGLAGWPVRRLARRLAWRGARWGARQPARRLIRALTRTLTRTLTRSLPRRPTWRPTLSLFRSLTRWTQPVLLAAALGLVLPPPAARAQGLGLFQALEQAELTPDNLERLAAGMRQSALSLDDTASVAVQIANWLQERDRVDEAVATLEFFMQELARKAGPDHEHVLWLMATLADVQASAGRHELALRLHRKALAGQLRTIGRDAPATRLNMLQTAMLLDKLNRPGEGADLMAEMVASAERAGGGLGRNALLARIDLGWMLIRAGRRDEARKVFSLFDQRLQKLLNRARPPGDLLLALGRKLTGAGQTARAARALRAAHEAMRSAGATADELSQVRTLLADALIASGDVEAALPLIGETLDRVRRRSGAQSRAYLEALDQYSRALRTAGRIEENAAVIDQRLRLARRLFGPDDVAALNVEKERLAALLEAGRNAEALEIARRVLAGFERAYGRRDMRTFEVRLQYTLVLGTIAPLEDALAAWDDLMAEATDWLGANHPDLTRIRAGRAMTLALRDPAASKPALADLARRQAEQYGPNAAQTAMTLSALALREFGLDRPFESLAALRRASAAQLARLRVAGGVSGAGVGPGAGRAAADERSLAGGGGVFRSSAWLHATAALLASRAPAQTLRARGETRDDLLNEAFRMSQLLFIDRTSQAVRRSQAFLAGAGRGQGDLFRRWSALRDEAARLDARMARTLGSAPEPEQGQEQGRGQEHGGQASGAGEVGDLAQRLARNGREIAEIETRFARDFPQLSSLLAVNPVTLARLRGGGDALLGPDDALVLVAAGRAQQVPNSIVWVVTRDRVAWAFVPGPQELSRQIMRLRAQLDRGSGIRLAGLRAPVTPGQAAPATAPAASPGGRMAGFDLALAHDIYRSLFGQRDVAAALEGKTNWIIIPQGSLLSLPFAALVREAPAVATATRPGDLRAAAWLGTTRSLTILPSVEALASLRDRAAPRDTRLAYLGIGAAEFSGAPAPLRGLPATARTDARSRLAAVRQLPRLPGTFDEIARLLAVFPPGQGRSVTGVEASETGLAKLAAEGTLGDSAIVHFATHGLLAGALDGLDEPALALTPPAGNEPRALAGGMLDDGLLTSSEIARLRLNADWVILSACNTAAGDRPDAEGLSGLTRAFFYAGARSLLVTHWEVRDDVAARLITDTVRAASFGMTRADALRIAMRRMIADTSQDDTALPLAHPALWAPFQFIGPPG